MATGTVVTKDRWLIEGRLTTDSPLHVGNGGTTTRPDLLAEAVGREPELVEIAAVATDHEGHAYIPGTTLKGNLRAWAREMGLDATLREVFGYLDEDDPNGKRQPGHGGSGEFWDAVGDQAPSLPHEPPYWESARLTGVTASVSIARTTRTASDQKLFHHEFVPPGVAFRASIAGGMTEDEVGGLLLLLESAKGGLSLGARTGDGWGRVTWHLDRLVRLDADGLRAWLVKPEGVGYAALRDLPPDTVESWRAEATRKATALAGRARPRIEVDIELHFDGSFLVNDPSQTRKEKGAGRRAGPAKPDRAPLRDRQGRPFLPASSFRGALRSQAERILRTLGGDKAACGEHLAGGACPPPASPADVPKLCPACRLFGSTGWRSPLGISDFCSDHPVREIVQDFLAIDAFTGGGANHLKFDAQAAALPVLLGTLSLDLEALDTAGGGAWVIGLISLALRDVHDGDVALGFGGGKGYGGCRIGIRRLLLPPWGVLPLTFQRSLVPLLPPAWEALGAPKWVGPSRLLLSTLGAWIKAIPKGGE